jgi:hypothetical protein
MAQTDGLKAANPTLPCWIAYPTAGCPVADDDWLDGSGGGLSPNRPWFSAGAAASADGCRRECLEEQRLGHHASCVSPVEPEFGSCKRQICKWFRLDMAGALQLPSSSLKGCRRSAYTRSGLQQGEQRGSAKPAEPRFREVCLDLFDEFLDLLSDPIDFPLQKDLVRLEGCPVDSFLQ